MVKWRNSDSNYGVIAIGLHWLIATAVTGLFILGLWMVELTYYDSWYRRAPDLHKSIGLSLFVIMMFRLIWRWINKKPHSLPGVSRFERSISSLVHWAINMLILLVILSGYLISTADGRPVDMFGVVTVPATVYGFEQQEEIAGDIHLVLAFILIGLSALHALAAAKHHFIDRDRTLARMFGR